MEIPESNVFDNIGLFDLRYFNNNKNDIPKACEIVYQVKRDPNVVELANQIKIHSYIDGEMLQRSKFLNKIKGYSILRINKGGSIIISGMHTDKSTTDPIAGRLIVNMINDLINN